MSDVERVTATARAGISRLRQQAQASEQPFGWWERDEMASVLGHITNEADSDFISRWSPSSVLLVLDGWERQLAAWGAVMARHRPTIVEAGVLCASCSVWELEIERESIDAIPFPCPDHEVAVTELAALAGLITTITGSTDD